MRLLAHDAAAFAAAAATMLVLMMRGDLAGGASVPLSAGMRPVDEHSHSTASSRGPKMPSSVWHACNAT